MMLNMQAQTVAFLQSIWLGAGFAVVYDLFRLIRRRTHAGLILTAVLDSLFWLFTLSAFFLFVVLTVRGDGRIYYVAGTVLGAALYFLTISPAVLSLLILLLAVFDKAFALILAVLRVPLAFFLKLKIKIQKKGAEIKKKHFHFSASWFKIKRITKKPVTGKHRQAECAEKRRTRR